MRQSKKQFSIPCPLHHGWAWLKQDNQFYQLQVSAAQCLGQPHGILEPAARQQHPWSSWMHYISQIMFRVHRSEQEPKQNNLYARTRQQDILPLIAHISDRRCWWSNEFEPLGLTELRKISTLWEKTVSWMDSLHKANRNKKCLINIRACIMAHQNFRTVFHLHTISLRHGSCIFTGMWSTSTQY